jgi:hypothetical protein
MAEAAASFQNVGRLDVVGFHVAMSPGAAINQHQGVCRPFTEDRPRSPHRNLHFAGCPYFWLSRPGSCSLQAARALVTGRSPVFRCLPGKWNRQVDFLCVPYPMATTSSMPMASSYQRDIDLRLIGHGNFLCFHTHE